MKLNGITKFYPMKKYKHYNIHNLNQLRKKYVYKNEVMLILCNKKECWHGFIIYSISIMFNRHINRYSVYNRDNCTL